MYTAYLVDDEELILDELIRTIPWMDNGFEVIGHNTSPNKALEEIEALAPDVVFSDLKMLGMDGNELIRSLKEDGVEAEFVMISAYDSFEKGRSAMRSALKKFAFSKNAMFDGSGGIIQFENYIEEKDEDGEAELTVEMLKSLRDSLELVFSGIDTRLLDIEEGYFGDYNIGMNVEDGAVAIGKDEDADFFGGDGDEDYDPVLCTNIFSMEKEQDYYV